MYAPHTYVNPEFINYIRDGVDPEWLADREFAVDKSNSNKVILSLFDYSGSWAEPYVKAGYDVYHFDIKHGDDVNEFCVDRLLNHYCIDDVYGVLAGVPCTDFACSGARWFAEKDRDGRTELSIELMRQTLRTIELYAPRFWVIENPVGRIPKLIPELNVKPWYFNPCDFAKGRPDEAYTKKTGLWGVFVPPTSEHLGVDLSVVPVLGSKMHRCYGGKSERTKELRSITPGGFADAFFTLNQ